MEINQTLKRLYHKDYKLIQTDLGLSNEISLIEVDNEIKAVLRVASKDINEFVHRQLEREIQLKIKRLNLDFEEVYYDNDEHYRITKYINNLNTFAQENANDKYLKVVSLIKKFHNLDLKTDIDFALDKKYASFVKNIKKPLLNYNQYQYIIDEFVNLPGQQVLSHNDLVDGNLLFKGDKAYLIDYEYAGNNHPLFDLMSFLSENQIYDSSIRETVYEAYFEHKPTPEELKTLDIIESAQNILWAAWANMLYDNRHEKIYLDIFNDKITALNIKK